MLITLLLLFLITLNEATRCKRQDVDMTEQFDKSTLFGNVHRDGTVSNAFIPYAMSQKQLDPPAESPFEFQKLIKPHDPVASVRDLYEQTRKQNMKNKGPTKKESEVRSRMWFDFEDLLDKHDEILNSGIIKSPPVTPSRQSFKEDHPPSNSKLFSKNSFDLNSNAKRKKQSLNWTTCQQIGGDGKFHPKDIMDIEWLPFYTWSMRYLPPVYPHVFSIPSVKTVKNYQEKFQNKIKVKIDWKSPKIVMKENQEILLIAIDRAGLFYGITDMILPEYAKNHPIEIVAIKLRLKIFDPYLFLMYCDYRYATIMAINGRGPETDKEKTLEAATIPFTGLGKPVTRDLEYERMRIEARIQREAELEARFSDVSPPSVVDK